MLKTAVHAGNAHCLAAGGKTCCAPLPAHPPTKASRLTCHCEGFSRTPRDIAFVQVQSHSSSCPLILTLRCWAAAGLLLGLCMPRWGILSSAWGLSPTLDPSWGSPSPMMAASCSQQVTAGSWVYHGWRRGERAMGVGDLPGFLGCPGNARCWILCVGAWAAM